MNIAQAHTQVTFCLLTLLRVLRAYLSAAIAVSHSIELGLLRAASVASVTSVRSVHWAVRPDHDRL